MAKPTNRAIPSRNRILQTLSAADYKRIEPSLTEEPLDFKEVLYEQGDRIERVYFVEEGVVSLVTILEDGEIETGTIGNEGMTGIHALLGADDSVERAICQIPGKARSMPLKVLRAEASDSALYQRLLRYTDAVIAMLAQSAACNRAHTIEQRMSRWLLATADRVGSDDFPLTQEFLAQMLGVQRPSVSLAGTALQRAGLIRYSRGKITITDRAGLEGASCECFERVRKQMELALVSKLKRPVH